MLLAALINPVLLAICCGIGVALCSAAGLNPHLREMYMSLVIFVIASQLALVPLLFIKRPTAMGLTQSALVGMVLHLILAIGLSLAMMLIAKTNTSFAFWTLYFYWVTLGGLAFVFVRAVRSATAASQQ